MSHCNLSWSAMDSMAENLRLIAGKSPAIAVPAHNLVSVMLAERQLKRHLEIDSALDSGLAGCIAR